MALPKKVQAQLAEVEALEKQLQAQKNPSPTSEEPEAEELDTEVEVPVEAEADPKPDKAAPADTSPTDVEEETFAQKYKSLLGKYDAEVPRLHQQVRDLNGELEKIRKDMSAQKVEPTKPKEKVSLVTDEDRAEYGEELLDVQRRVAQEVAQGYEEKLEQQNAVISALQEKLSQTGNQIGDMDFNQRLHLAMPEFSQIDTDERWHAWLNEHDPMLRGPRRVQAQAAFDAGDVEAVQHYVQLWQNTLPESNGAKQTRQAELEKQVAPSRSAPAAQQPMNSNAKLYSSREMDAAWNKVSLMLRRGKLDEASKLEAELSAAYTEGRVRP